jgi:hypothetical protein
MANQKYYPFGESHSRGIAGDESDFEKKDQENLIVTLKILFLNIVVIL